MSTRAGRLGALAAAPLLLVAALSLLTIARDAGSATWATLPDGRLFEAAADAAPRPDAGAVKDGQIDAMALDVVRGDLGPLQDTAKPIPPDPTPLVSDAQFTVGFKYDKGTLAIERVRREVLAKPAAVPRHFGRFAVELYVGPTLIERIRFDIPLLGDDSTTSEAFERGLVTTVEVKVPDSDRPTRLEVWDRATDKRWVFSYPPRTP